MPEILEKQLLAAPVVAIARHVPTDRLLPAAHALYKGGVRFVEVTLNSQGALEGIAALAAEFAGTDMVIGAGTVIGRENAEAALAAGARFLVCPHTDPAVIAAALEADALPLPGVMTPTDMAMATAAGAKILKLFPAGALGVAYVKQVRGPFNKVPLLAVGGVDLKNAADYLAAGCVGLGLGSALVDNKVIAAGDYDELTRRAAAYMALFKEA